MTHPFGPLTPAEFQEAVDAPYGQAGVILRKHDPLWGRFKEPGQKIKWRAVFHQTVTMRAFATVEAGSEEEAQAAAELIPDKDLNFDDVVDSDYGELISVEPV